MRDSIDFNVETLYSAYLKVLNAENVINESRNKIYGYRNIELPDKSMKVDGYQFNDDLIEDDFVNSMRRLVYDYGDNSEGSVEKTRKHIYNLLKIIAEIDSRARSFFDEIQYQENSTIESFSSGSDTSITRVNEYSDDTGIKSDSHTGTAKISGVSSVNYNNVTEANSYTGNASFSNSLNVSDTPIKSSENHNVISETIFEYRN